MTDSMPLVLPTHVCVLGIRRNTFVEFTYMVGDADLSIELIMPIPAFHEFCRRQNASVDDARGLLAEAAAGPCRNDSRPGLYHEPAWHQSPPEP